MRLYEWIWLPIAGVIAYVVTRNPSSASSEKLNVSNAVIDAATRTLLAETSFRQSPREMSSILQVGINRAKETGDLLAVFTPPGKPNWNRSATFKRRWDEARGYPQWSKARAFVVDVFAGKYPNLIGDRKYFLHPAGMPKCQGQQCPRGRQCVNTTAGRRCLPTWSSDDVALVIDEARFS